ncbi:histidine kinase dimerization/phosphoacceptor domain -containing protein [Sphingomonas sp. ASV193]|uniref:sensor histidine kinase n=1 Tax=Sphingomonas sp. ASV193 TaxID=3144405 RepID=UPI0032E8FE80
MSDERSEPQLSTPLRLMLALSGALLPLGALSVYWSVMGLRGAERSIHQDAEQEADVATQTIDALIARNVLALRLAAQSVVDKAGPQSCDAAEKVLAAAPGVAHMIEIENSAGKPLCTSDDAAGMIDGPATMPGEIRAWVSHNPDSVLLRVGVRGGSATTRLSQDELRRALIGASSQSIGAELSDGDVKIALLANPDPAGQRGQANARGIAANRLHLVVTSDIPTIGLLQRAFILLPVLMWVIAVLISWLLVNRLLIVPLRRLQAAASELQAGDTTGLVVPEDRGQAVEIRSLGLAFSRAIDRIEQGEKAMAEALEGQRKLVREVHHRVKNNLQVVASMLSIHGRTADGPEARAAYSAIGRRVSALSVVHRNHYAELEENKGISLRPMLTELAGELRASAPENARAMPLELELEPLFTTQDAAVAAAFIVTEVVEYAMLHGQPRGAVEVVLRRSGELTGQLTLIAAVLMEDHDSADGPSERRQFERILDGLARQLRSPLERKQGRYSVDLPVFPRG